MGEMGGALLLNDNQGCVHIIDPQTGAMEMIQSWFRGVVVGAIPFEIDWSAFFIVLFLGLNLEELYWTLFGRNCSGDYFWVSCTACAS